MCDTYVVCSYLWVVVPAPFESFVYEANFQVSLEPRGWSLWSPRLFHWRLFSSEETELNGNKKHCSVMKCIKITFKILVNKTSLAFIGNAPVLTWISVLPLPLFFSSISFWRLVFYLVAVSTPFSLLPSLSLSLLLFLLFLVFVGFAQATWLAEKKSD